MTIYQAIKEICMDIGISSDSLSDVDSISEEDYEVLIRDINFKTVLDNIQEDRYYNKLIRKVNSEEIYILDKLYIRDSWVNVLIIFSDNNLGVNVEIMTFSVDYFTEDGENINVENLGIVDSLRDQELREMM